jgi:glycine dehydrogenase subunit 2
VGIGSRLERFLPIPVVERGPDGRYFLDHDRPESIGRMLAYYGHFGVMVRALTYLLSLGDDGLRAVTRRAVMNANYLLCRLKDRFDLPFPGPCMHEFVLSGRKQKERGVRTMDIAKRLLDYGVHSPTVYFPLIVPEALMIEPTETESKASLDAFAEALLRIAEEVEAARNPCLKWSPEDREG